MKVGPSTSTTNTLLLASRLSSARSQSGVALLTILLLVVSITVVAGAMLASQKVAIRKSSLLFEQDQLLQGLQAGQQLAVALIEADNKLNDSDSSQDVWAQPIPPYASEAYTLTIEVYDEASRFNINNLYHDGAVDEAALASLQRLLSSLGMDEGLATVILDWQDPDVSVYQDSADETTVYQSGLSATNDSSAMIQVANQAFVNIEQLAELPGVTPEILQRLRPYLTAVPYYLPVNINTADPLVLAALVPNDSGIARQAFASNQQAQLIDSEDKIWQTPPFDSVSEQQRKAIAPLIAVESRAFSAIIIAASGGADAAYAKQRYATVLISKLPSQAAEKSSAAANAAEKPNKIIRAYSQRLWPFRPKVAVATPRT